MLPAYSEICVNQAAKVALSVSAANAYFQDVMGAAVSSAAAAARITEARVVQALA
jgi:hypothetical protein